MPWAYGWEKMAEQDTYEKGSLMLVLLANSYLLDCKGKGLVSVCTMIDFNDDLFLQTGTTEHDQIPLGQVMYTWTPDPSFACSAIFGVGGGVRRGGCPSPPDPMKKYTAHTIFACSSSKVSFPCSVRFISSLACQTLSNYEGKGLVYKCVVA